MLGSLSFMTLFRVLVVWASSEPRCSEFYSDLTFEVGETEAHEGLNNNITS